MNAIELDGIEKSYDSGQRVIDGLTLHVPEGQIFGFLGINGAGKTTTIRILAGLQRSDTGRTRIFGREVEPGRTEHLGEIGFVLDEPMYFDWMSPEEYWKFAGGMYGLEHTTISTRLTELLGFFDLQEKKDDPIATLSTGMKKKVSLGAALIHRPKLIVLDEPLEGIDALAASTIKEALMLAAKKGTTVFLTSHVLDTVERLCTDVAILHRGTVILQCPTSAVRSLVRPTLPSQTYASLEELFVDTVSDGTHRNRLTFLEQ
jgi:ABC-2 type transport system ATP-binding protein